MLDAVPSTGRPSGPSPSAELENTSWDVVGGIVFMHGDFFEDDPALGLDVVAAQQGGRHHVGDDVDSHRKITIEHPRVVTGLLARGKGVELTADRFERGGNLQRAAGRGAFEKQVLQVVRSTCLRQGFVA